MRGKRVGYERFRFWGVRRKGEKKEVEREEKGEREREESERERQLLIHYYNNCRNVHFVQQHISYLVCYLFLELLHEEGV